MTSSSASGRSSDVTSSSASGDPPDRAYSVVDSRVSHEGMMSTLRIDRVSGPDGSVMTREVAEHLDAVAVVPLTDDRQVVLVRQYRHPVRRYELEVPAGILDVDGEAAYDAAVRELAEETGLRAARLERVTRFWNSAGWSDESTTIFVATGLTPAPHDEAFVAEGEEADMVVLRMPLEDALAKVRSGEIGDAKTIIGLLLVANGAPAGS